MSDKDEKVNYRKETYIVVLTTVLSTVVGKVSGWLEKVDWKVPEWVMQAAAWFADKTPVNNAVLMWSILTSVYVIWTGLRIVLHGRRLAQQMRTTVEGTREALTAADQIAKVLDDQNEQLQQELSTTKTVLAGAQQQLDLARQELAARYAKPELKGELTKPSVPDHPHHEVIYRDFREATIDSIYWRWKFSTGKLEPYGFEPFCTMCDYPLDLSKADVDYKAAKLMVTCPKCSVPAELPCPAEDMGKAAEAEVKRAIRNNLWTNYIEPRKTRSRFIYAMEGPVTQPSTSEPHNSKAALRSSKKSP